MDDKEQRLLRQFIYDYEEVLARNCDREWTFPAEWTDEEKAAFVREYHECHGDPGGVDPSLIWLPEYAVLTNLCRKLERYFEEQNPKRQLPRMSFHILPKQKTKTKFVVIGWLGGKTVYINKTREEAIRLYIAANYPSGSIETGITSAPPEELPVEEFEAMDVFEAYDVSSVEE